MGDKPTTERTLRGSLKTEDAIVRAKNLAKLLGVDASTVLVQPSDGIFAWSSADQSEDCSDTPPDGVVIKDYMIVMGETRIELGEAVLAEKSGTFDLSDNLGPEALVYFGEDGRVKEVEFLPAEKDVNWLPPEGGVYAKVTNPEMVEELQTTDRLAGPAPSFMDTVVARLEDRDQ